jgi:hypothetical protein
MNHDGLFIGTWLAARVGTVASQAMALPLLEMGRLVQICYSICI